MSIFEAVMIIFMPSGTLLLNAWRHKTGHTRSLNYGLYALVSLVMAIAPLFYVRSVETNQTALGVVLACIAFFWFPIVGGRSANT
mgnify:CR=1 FL=1